MLGALLGAAADAPARQAVAAQVGSLPTDLALLRYNPRELDDRQFAALAKSIAESSDSETWPRVVVQNNEGVLSVVDRVYDFYLGTRSGDTSEAAPLTVQQLSDSIREANGLASDALPVGKELKVPPMIGRPQTAAPRPTAPVVMAWTPDAKAALYSDEGWRVRGGPGVGGIQRANVIEPVRWDVEAFERLGLRRSTDITVAVEASQARTLVEQGVGTIPPQNRVQVEFFQDRQCEASFPDSPYKTMARSQVARSLDRMKVSAAKVPLVLVDHDFRDGHGAQVRAVVERVLGEFGAADLTTFVRNFELDRTAPAEPGAPHPIVGAMRRYDAYLSRLSVADGDERADAADWFLQLTDDPPSRGPNIVPIAPYVLKAALAASMQDGAWLNLSWRGDREDPVLPFAFENLVTGHNVFAAVAAGNERQDVLVRSPQNASSLRFHFVNVTNGTADGDVCGSRTGTQGVRVHVMAEGRSTDANGGAVFGSSFATPVVAAAAWLRHLIDQTAADRMRARLVAASTYLPGSSVRTVDAKGVFDPARLLADTGAHYLAADTGAPVSVKAMSADLGHCGLFQNDQDSPSRDLVVYRAGAGHEVNVRVVSTGVPGDSGARALPAAVEDRLQCDHGQRLSRHRDDTSRIAGVGASTSLLTTRWRRSHCRGAATV